MTQQSAALLFGISNAHSEHDYAPQDFLRAPISALRSESKSSEKRSASLY
jgi:hypothetical protein